MVVHITIENCRVEWPRNSEMSWSLQSSFLKHDHFTEPFTNPLPLHACLFTLPLIIIIIFFFFLLHHNDDVHHRRNLCHRTRTFDVSSKPITSPIWFLRRHVFLFFYTSRTAHSRRKHDADHVVLGQPGGHCLVGRHVYQKCISRLPCGRRSLFAGSIRFTTAWCHHQ